MGSAEMAGAAASGGLISIVVALPIGWIGGIIYAFIINLALKLWGSRLKCSKLFIITGMGLILTYLLFG